LEIKPQDGCEGDIYNIVFKDMNFAWQVKEKNGLVKHFRCIANDLDNGYEQ
jgi:hypothetical protein